MNPHTWIDVLYTEIGPLSILSGILSIPFSSTELNVCISEPCQNDGTCNEYENMFNCTCAEGFSGTLCETGKMWWIPGQAFISLDQLDPWIWDQQVKAALSRILTTYQQSLRINDKPNLSVKHLLGGLFTSRHNALIN